MASANSVFRFSLSLLVGVLAVPRAYADQTMCVADVAGLQSALAAWTTAPDGSLLTVQLVQGTYDIDNASGRTLGQYTAINAASLRILGGYPPGCDNAARTIDPRNTIIDGHDQAGSQLELLALDGNGLFEGLTFTRLAAGVQMVHDGSHPGSGHVLRINLCRVIANTSQSTGYTLRLWGFGSGNSGATVALENSLVARNQNGSTAYFAVLSAGNNGAITLDNNTVVDNASASGMQLQSWNGVSNLTFDVINNIVWHNGISGVYHDLDVSSAAVAPAITYTLAGSIVGSIQSTATNLAVDPQFVDAPGGNYRLKDASPAFDSGAPTQPGGYPAQDIDGHARALGAWIDRGAYETTPNDFIFVDSFGG